MQVTTESGLKFWYLDSRNGIIGSIHRCVATCINSDTDIIDIIGYAYRIGN